VTPSVPNPDTAGWIPEPIVIDNEKEELAKGMASAALAMLLFSVMSALAKYLSARHSVIEIAFYRNVFGILPFLAWAFLFGRRDILVVRSRPGLLVTRAIMGTVTLITSFAAFALMPMAETSVLLFTASLFLPVLGVIFLEESVGPWRWSAVVIGFLGVAMMLRPGGGLNTIGVSFALGAAMLQAIMGILLRRLGGFERPETIALYFFLIGICLTGLAMPFVAVKPTLDELPLFALAGLVGAGAQFLLAMAFKHAPAAIVAVLNYTTLIWSTALGLLIFGDWPPLLVFIGSAIVISANLLIIWRERQMAIRRGAARSAGVEP
jgi:drug/metabolite transporter (DMT)-like permease